MWKTLQPEKKNMEKYYSNPQYFKELIQQLIQH